MLRDRLRQSLFRQSLWFGICAATVRASIALALPSNPIVFVTQPPWPSDFATVNSTFGNHRASLDAVPRGGDLYIRYADGTLKNLTLAAGYGMSGLQGSNAIAVRDPSVSWDATKVIFSMVVGAPSHQYEYLQYRWQLYEITGLGPTDTPVITKVANQPTDYNNVSPVYGTDDTIIFTTDRPRDGAAHLYPQRDEYESTATNTGLWKLNPTTGALTHLDHAPSGDFTPIIDSYGRVIFTRWDHLQRDQQNRCSNPDFEAFNYSSESSDATILDTDAEVYPEPRGTCEDDTSDNLDRHSFNLFLPWQINEDGTEMETLNHIGRHELVGYISKSINDDPNVVEYYRQYSRTNENPIESFFQIREDPTHAGRYVGIQAPEFGTHASGQIVSLDGDPAIPADLMQVTYITHEDTSGIDETPSADHIGLSRDPLPLSDGTLIASRSASTLQDSNVGTSGAPQSRYDYRLMTYAQNGAVYQPATNLTSGIQKTISFWSPDNLISYTNVTMWELQAREVVARTRPQKRSSELPTIEQGIFDSLGISVQELKDYMSDNALALVVSRNLTTRDELDLQQPVNLRVANGGAESVPLSGKVYDIAHLQFFQGDQIRGYGSGTPSEGRRVIAQVMHDVTQNPENPSGPAGSVAIASDGSMAAFVPATRALTYQVTDAEGKGVVRERLWLTFQPGEIRVCASCHGVNSKDHLGNGAPQNEPLALRELLQTWKSIPHDVATFDLSAPTKIKGGKRLNLAVSGNSAAKNKNVTLSLKINRYSCGTVATASTDASSALALAAKLPSPNKKARLSFSLLYGGGTKDSVNVALQPGKKSKRLKDKKICSAIKAAIK